MIEKKKEKFQRNDNQVKIDISLGKERLERLENRAARRYNYFKNRATYFQKEVENLSALAEPEVANWWMNLQRHQKAAERKVEFWEDRLKQIHNCLTELIILE